MEDWYEDLKREAEKYYIFIRAEYLNDFKGYFSEKNPTREKSFYLDILKEKQEIFRERIEKGSIGEHFIFIPFSYLINSYQRRLKNGGFLTIDVRNLLSENKAYIENLGSIEEFENFCNEVVSWVDLFGVPPVGLIFDGLHFSTEHHDSWVVDKIFFDDAGFLDDSLPDKPWVKKGVGMLIRFKSAQSH